MPKLKVRIALTVEVDTEDWTSDYGVSGTAAIRSDVKEYVRNVIAGSTEALEVVQ